VAGCGQVAEGPEGEIAALLTHVLYCTGKNLYCTGKNLIIDKQ